MLINKKNYILIGLSIVSVILLWMIFYSPIWWVSLKAPQYPATTFPDGIRIHFHVNGVFNGCKKIESKEKSESEALNCKHEMDAINHYVGMYPIAAGAPVERAMSAFVFVLLAAMIIAFALPDKKHKAIVLLLTALVISAWGYKMLYTQGGILLASTPYLDDMTSTMSLDKKDIQNWTGKEAIEKSYHEALVRYFPTQEVNCQDYVPLLKYMLIYSGQGRTFFDLNDVLVNGGVTTSRLMGFFKKQYAYLQQHKNIAPEKYEKEFLQQCQLQTKKSTISDKKRTQIILTIVDIFYVVLVVAMFGLAFALLKFRVANWLLIFVPMALPIFFILDYAGWLWWFGHNLSTMGAFTVKPFMPTVFGVGKVAQFSTYSYPYIGFAYICLLSVVTGAMALIQFKDEQRDND